MISVITLGPSAGLDLIAAVDDPSNREIVLVPEGAGPVPTERLSELFLPEFGIGAVVPQIRRPDGRLVEAGLVQIDGRRVSRHLGAGGADLAETAADVDGTDYPWLAFRRDLLAGQAIDPTATPERLAAQVLAAVAAAQLRVVYEPGWIVQTSKRRSGALLPPDRSSADRSRRILVVTGFLAEPSLLGTDRLTAALIDDLAHVAGGGSLTVAVLDGFSSDQPAAVLRSRGIEVVAGPNDWDSWFKDRWGRFDHVFLTRSALPTPVRDWLGRTQPQAVRVLCLDSISFRAIEGQRPIARPDDLAGLEYYADESMAHLRQSLAEFNAVICGRASDAAYVRSAAPGRLVMEIPPPVDAPPRKIPASQRAGLVVLGTDGYDLTLGNEAAVYAAIATAVVDLRQRDPNLRVTVVSDRPSPQLARTAREASLEVVPVSGAPLALRRARVALALHRFGVGGRDAILAAMSARTPFVASPVAADDLELGLVRNRSVFGDPVDIRFRIERLLRDDTYWAETQDLIDGLVAAHYQASTRRDLMVSLLAQTGRDTKQPRLDWPVPAPPDPVIGSVPPPMPKHRPGWAPTVSLGPVPRPSNFDMPADERYRLWHERHGASPAVFDQLSKDLAGKRFRPLISVVMPVYNTDADVLTAAIESIRDQLYENWQICIADDASTRPETRQVLADLDGDPHVKVCRLERNAGISGATNAALALAEGQFVAFMDHDDLLKPHALAQVVRWLNADPSLDVVYTDEDKVDRDGALSDPHLKPDWSPDLLMSLNYISHLTVMRRTLVEEVGGLREGFEGSQDYDLLLRVTERTSRIAHIPEPLYSWRAVEGSEAAESGAKPYAADAAKRALAEALQRRRRNGWVEATRFPTFYRTRYALPGTPRVSIIIPTRDRADLLRACVNSILERSTYGNYEIVVVDNQSDEGETLEFLARSPVRVVPYPHRFNYARQMNLAAASCQADALLFLNNDTEVITPEWIEALLEHAMRPEVGAVGGRLYYTDGKVQHEGILVGSAGGWAWNVDHAGYFARGDLVRNVSAVTGACTMIRSTVYARIGGNDEQLRVAYNDVDICLRARQAGFQVVYTPYAELYHHEGATRRGFEHDEDGPVFSERWQVLDSVDPYHSPLFINDRTDTAFMLAL